MARISEFGKVGLKIGIVGHLFAFCGTFELNIAKDQGLGFG